MALLDGVVGFAGDFEGHDGGVGVGDAVGEACFVDEWAEQGVVVVVLVFIEFC